MAKSTVDFKHWKAVKVSPASIKKLKAKVNDNYLEMLEEWFLLKHPKFRFDPNHHGDFKKFLAKHQGRKNLDACGAWFYFPWSNQVVHVLDEKMHLELRTGRNRFLISETEQRKYYNSRVGLLGMSVGSHVALTIAMTGGAKRMRLADPDTISGSNLNRIRTGVTNVGLPKVISVARQIYEMNPYAEVEIFPEGFSEKNAKKFLRGLNLLVEEMDNPYFKLRVREIARPMGIPVIMAADNADGIIVDVERFDLNKRLPILHGILGKMTAQDFKEVEPRNLPKVLAKMAGAQMSTVRMLESVMQVGKKLYSWPQLGNAATLCGSVLTYLGRMVLVGEKVPSGRTDFSVAKTFLPATKAELKKRDQIFKMMGIR